MNNIHILEGEYVFIKGFLDSDLKNCIIENDNLIDFLSKQKMFSPFDKQKNLLLFDPTTDNLQLLELELGTFRNNSQLYLIYEETFPDFRIKFLNNIKKENRYHLFESIRPFDTSQIKWFLSNFDILDDKDKAYLISNPPLISKTVRVDGEKKEINVVNLSMIENFAFHKEIENISAQEYFADIFFEMWTFLDTLLDSKYKSFIQQIQKINKINFEKIFNILKSQLELYLLVKTFGGIPYNEFIQQLKNSQSSYYLTPQRYEFIKKKTNIISIKKLEHLYTLFFNSIEDSRQSLETNSILLSFISQVVKLPTHEGEASD